jgi:hypothetical protein
MFVGLFIIYHVPVISNIRCFDSSGTESVVSQETSVPSEIHTKCFSQTDSIPQDLVLSVNRWCLNYLKLNKNIIFLEMKCMWADRVVERYPRLDEISLFPSDW